MVSTYYGCSTLTKRHKLGWYNKPMVRCKVTCSYKQPVSEGVHVHLVPVTSGSDENKEFFRYTPGGQFSFYTVNQAAADKFEVGKQYYLDFTPAD